MNVKEMTNKELKMLTQKLLSKEVSKLYLTEEGKKWIIDIMNGKYPHRPLLIGWSFCIVND